MDEALVPHARRLRIRRSNFCLLSNIASKESTLQLVYDVMRLSAFFKAFLVTTDVLEIYMQEFWATTTVHHHSIRFKMDNKKHIINLESFREMLHICPRLPHQPFVEPPFEEEILAFLRFPRHSGAIRRLTDVNINKLHQTWRSFAAIINKCLTGKSSGYDSLCPRLTTSEKGKQVAKASKAKSLSALSEVAMAEAQQLRLATKRSMHQTHISQASGSCADEGIGYDDDEGQDDDDDDDAQDGDDQEDEGNDEDDEEEETRDEESFDPILKTPKNTDDEGNGEENLGTNISREEGHDEEDEADELYKDVNINLGRGIQLGDVHTTQEVEDSHMTLTLVNPNGQQQSSSVSSQFVT
nr:hypothetical protein [Tanacetum cinerariifolium]